MSPHPTVFPEGEAPAPGRGEVVLLLVAGATAALAVTAAAYAAWMRPGFDHATGSWFTLAHDLLRGELYRPLVGESGFGGTRWLPLFPALLAALKWQGVGYIHAAWWINGVALAAVVLAVRSIVRSEGADPRVAWVFGVLSVCSLGAMMTLRAFRGDLLPVALAVWGVRLAMKAVEDGDRPVTAAAAALLFAAAASAKSTAVFWPLAVIVSYVLNRRFRLAFVLAGTVGAALAAVLLAIQWASDGRFFSVMSATSAAGGGLFRALLGPMYLERYVRGSDPLGLLAAGGSFLVFAAAGRRAWTSVPGCLVVSMIVMSALIFGSPGTIENHLVDLSVATMTLFGIGWARLRLPRSVVAGALFLYAVTMIPPSVSYWVSPQAYFRDQAVEHLKTLPGSVLSEHPAVPLLAGKHPYVLDTFMLRVLRESRPEVERALREAIAEQRYDTVILSNLDKEKGFPPWYEVVHFGRGFLEMLRESYVLDREIGNFSFFRPKVRSRTSDLPADPADLAERTRDELLHAWSAYERHAWGRDELAPLALEGRDWYDESLLMTPVDALDALILLGCDAEARRARDLVTGSLRFDRDFFVSAFEVNIRILGGLLSAHQLTGDARLLELAEDLGRRLLPVFDSPTGMPYREVNLRTGEARHPRSNPAEIGTWILELGTLSGLTGDPRYFEAAKRAVTELHSRRSALDLVGSRIDVETGRWLDPASHIGGGIDSYLEYLWKGWQLFGDEDLHGMWEIHARAVARHLAVERDGERWYARVDMDSGGEPVPFYSGLQAFYAGVLAIAGKTEAAARFQESGHRLWKFYGVLPERYLVDAADVPPRGAPYYLRPELIESAYHLYRQTGDERYRSMGRDYLGGLIRRCRTDSAYAAVADVRLEGHLDSMESFFLAETLEYLYLLLAGDPGFDLDRAVFTTEAHPLWRTW